MIWNGLVDPYTGDILRKFEEVNWDRAHPVEGNPGLFSNGLYPPFYRVVVDAEAQTIRELPQERAVVFSKEREIFRLNKDGSRAWTVAVIGSGNKGRPDIRFMPMSCGEVDGVFIGEYLDGTRAIDIESGRLLWHVPDFFLEYVKEGICAGTLRVGTTRSSFVMVDTKTGRVVQDSGVDMQMIQRVHPWRDKFLLIGRNTVFENLSQPSYLVDQQGKALHLCAEPFSSLFPLGDSYLFATNTDIRCLTPAWGGICNLRWKYVFPLSMIEDGDGLWIRQRRKLWHRSTAVCAGENNEVFAANIGRILRNGSMVACIDTNTGDEKWLASCPPPEVPWDDIGHPADLVYLELRGSELIVVAQGSSSFVEVLDAKSGKRLRRFDYLTYWR